MKIKHEEWLDVKVNGNSIIRVNGAPVRVSLTFEGDNREAVLLMEQRLQKALPRLAEGD